MKLDWIKLLALCAAFVLPTASFATTTTDQISWVTPTQDVVSQADDKDKDKDDDKKKKK